MNLLMPALEVQMECYEGPLALLVSLIKKNKVSIWDIPLSLITGRFLEYVELASEMRLRIAEDFIEIASLLMFIKSKMLLPSEETDTGEDPEQEIIGRIIEYERVKGMVGSMDSLAMLNRDTFCRGVTFVEGKTDYDLLYLSRLFFDMIKNKEELFIAVREIKPTLEEKLLMLRSVLDLSGFYVWDMDGQASRSERVATILGLLELTKVKVTTLTQRRHFGKIIVRKRDIFQALPEKNEDPQLSS
jgi:segregation and condensation protein A